MSSSTNLLRRPATSRLRNGLQQRKNFRRRRLKILSQARWCLRRPITKFHSPIIINGGATSKALTGVTRSDRKAISKGKRIILWCRSLTLTRKRTRNGPGNVCQLKQSLNLPRAAGYREKRTCGAMNFDLVENGWRTRGREDFR